MSSTKDDCLFCKIVRDEIPSYKVYEDGDFIAILDRFPVSMGHTLIIPKNHCDDLFDLQPELAERVIPLAQKLAGRIREVTGCEGLNLGQNNGEAAGQAVRHFHLHIVPRFANDGVSVAPTGTKRRLDPAAEEFEGIVGKLKD